MSNNIPPQQPQEIPVKMENPGESNPAYPGPYGYQPQYYQNPQMWLPPNGQTPNMTQPSPMPVPNANQTPGQVPNQMMLSPFQMNPNNYQMMPMNFGPMMPYGQQQFYPQMPQQPVMPNKFDVKRVKTGNQDYTKMTSNICRENGATMESYDGGDNFYEAFKVAVQTVYEEDISTEKHSMTLTKK